MFTNNVWRSQEFCDVYNIDANKISCEYFSFNTKSKINVGKTPTIDMLLQFEHDKLKQIKGPRRPLDPIEGKKLALMRWVCKFHFIHWFKRKVLYRQLGGGGVSSVF